jgi:acyl-CoA hydrolase
MAEKHKVSHSRTIMAQVALPSQANPAGNVHGGEIMKMMDNMAYVVAQKHCHMNNVTAAVDEINFHNPAYVGNLLTCYGELIYTSNSAMLIAVSVYVEDLVTEEETCALTAYFVMVALGEDGKAAKIPQLELETDLERAKYEEGKARYEAIKSRPRVCWVPLA